METEGGVKMRVENRNTEEWTLHSIYRYLPTYNTIRQEGKDDLLSFKTKAKTILCVFLYIFTHKQTKTRKKGAGLGYVTGYRLYLVILYGLLTVERKHLHNL